MNDLNNCKGRQMKNKHKGFVTLLSRFKMCSSIKVQPDMKCYKQSKKQFGLFCKASCHLPNSKCLKTGLGHAILACTQHHVHMQANVSENMSGHTYLAGSPTEHHMTCFSVDRIV